MNTDAKACSANKLVSDLRDLADWIEAGVIVVQEIYTDCHVAIDEPMESTLSIHYVTLPVRHNA